LSLAALLRILGIRQLARRLGVKPATVERWIRAGAPSKRGQQRLAEVAKRREAGLRGQETKRKRIEFRERLIMPEHPTAASSVTPFAPGYLTPEQMLPAKPPIEIAERIESIRKRRGFEGSGPVNTDRHIGVAHWWPINQLLVEVDVDDFAERVIRTWQDSGHTWVHVVCMMFRYIPHNPFYMGEMIRKKGRWFDFWIQSPLMSPGISAINNIAIAINVMLAKSMRAAETRIIWWEAAKVSTFDSKRDLPSYAKTAGRQLRAT